VSSKAPARRHAPRRLAASRGRRALTWTLRAAGAGLAFAHVDLLVRRIADASILEPLVAARWLGTAALAAAAVEIHRRGFALWRGRSGWAFALVVLLLHAGGAVPAPTSASDSLFILPAGLLAAAALWAGITGSVARPLRFSAPSLRFSPFPPRFGAAAAGFDRALFSRPPPVAA
jgi:hypothetical protein